MKKFSHVPPVFREYKKKYPVIKNADFGITKAQLILPREEKVKIEKQGEKFKFFVL